LRQLNTRDVPRLYYLLVIWVADRWDDFLVIPRERMQDHRDETDHFGTENASSGSLVLTVQFRPDSVRCGGADLTGYRRGLDLLPAAGPSASGGASHSGRRSWSGNLRGKGHRARGGRWPVGWPCRCRPAQRGVRIGVGFVGLVVDDRVADLQHPLKRHP